MARATGGGSEDRDSSRKPPQRSSEPRVKQDNRGKDNQGRGPLVDNKDAGRKDDNRRPRQPGPDPRATNRGDRNDQPGSSAGRPTYGGG